MDADAELQLYNHVEFLTAPNNPRREESNLKNVPNSKKNQRKKKKQKQPPQISTLVRNKVAKPQQSRNVSSVKYQLSAEELLFFPKSYDPSPVRQTKTDPNHLHRKKNYFEKVKELTPEEKREFRAQRDIRYLHKSGSKNREEDEKVICLDHLIGRCNSVDCGRWHQVRHQRLFGACKFYLSGVCKNGDSCQYMHEEFPCRYYHLDLEHPKLAENERCRFKHGGPLSNRLRQYFRKQIGIWASKIASSKPEQLDDISMNLMNKFEAKQSKLGEKCEIEHTGTSLMPSSSDRFSLESILPTNQLKRLADRNITNAIQINQLPVEELLDLGLSVDEIYKITINTCDESCQTPFNADIQPTESNLEVDLLMLSRLETNDNSFQGFSEIDMKDAIGTWHNRRLELHITTGMITEEADLEVKYNETAEKTCQPENTEAADSDDSDNEFNLIINEDFSYE